MHYHPEHTACKTELTELTLKSHEQFWLSPAETAKEEEKPIHINNILAGTVVQMQELKG